MANFLLSFLRKYLVLCKKSTVVNMLAMSVVKGIKHWFGVCWSVLWLMRQWHMDTVWVINVVGKNPACNQHTFWTCWLRDKPSVLYLQWLDAVGWAAVKKMSGGVLAWLSDWSSRDADLLTAQVMTLPLTVSCFSKIQIGFTFPVSAHLGGRGKRAVKQVCVTEGQETYYGSPVQPCETDIFIKPILLLYISTSDAK